MRIGTLNVAHQTRPPKKVPGDLLDALLDLDLDVLVLTEFVETPAYREAIAARWKHVLSSEQTPRRSGFHNQVCLASKKRMEPLGGLPAIPTHTASTNFLAARIGGSLDLTGLRAPAFKVAADRSLYWETVARHLSPGIVIGDFNLNPERSRREASFVPTGWTVVTPESGGPSFRSLKNKTSSTVDHAFVSKGIRVRAAEYRPEFFGKWGLDHCPLVVYIRRSPRGSS